MATNVFQDPTKSLPKKDEQIVRIDFSKQDMAAAPSAPKPSGSMSIQHVPNAGSKH